jgi:hypothetical protein
MLSFKVCAQGALLVSYMLVSGPAEAQQILSAVESRRPGGAALSQDLEPKEALVSSQAGQLLSTTFGGADSRALTDYGVNKIYSRGTATHRQYATSNWLDTYTVSGTPGTNVDVSFTFSIDGNVIEGSGYSGRAEVNFNVYALRGTNWSLGGETGLFSSDYNQLSMTSTPDSSGRIYQFNPSSFGANQFSPERRGAVSRYQNQGGTIVFIDNLDYDETTQSYSQWRSFNSPTGTVESFRTLTSAGSQEIRDGVTRPFVPWPANPQPTVWQNLNNTYPVLDVARLCDNPFGFCASGVYPGTDLTVSFTLAAGSSFSLLSSLHTHGLYDDVTVDFFNTARVTGISVSGGGSLTSGSGSLTALPGGGFGYPAAFQSGVVPEPASWALMITGFGLVGLSLRRRRRPVALA